MIFNILFLAKTAIARDIKFEANLDRQRIAIGERAQLGLSFQNTQAMPAPDIGNIDGLEIRYLGPSTMMTVINGRVSSSITHMYNILPLRTGKFQIGPFLFKYKGDAYTSNMVFLEVGEEKAAMPIQKEETLLEEIDLEDRLFLSLNVGKRTAYANELIPVTVKLYVNRMNVSNIQLPTFEQEGFSKVEFKEPKQYREELNGLIYDVLEFKTEIFGTKAGDYRLGPAKIKCNVMVRKARPVRASISSSPFDDEDRFRDSFFDDFFTRYERHPIELKSDEAQIAILSLPSEGRPKDFSGAVGDYQFIFNANPTKVKVGDPITLRMDINGRGNFNTVLIPELENATGFKVYEPQAKTGENSKSFTQVFIPETDLVTQIPKAVFNYFDPSMRAYRSISQGPVPIQVEKGREELPSRIVGPTAAEQDISRGEEPTRDIIYIKESAGRWMPKGSLTFRSKRFLALAILPLFCVISIFLIQHRKVSLESDTVYASRIRGMRFARSGLKELRRELKRPDPKIFYEILFKTIQNYLGARLRMRPEGITFDAVRAALGSGDIDPAILNKMKVLFDICDEARFAFSKIDSYMMKDNVKDLEEILNYMERKKI